MRVLDIKTGTIVDGVGMRTSIYFAGCAHHCKGCHNPQSWNFDGGKEMSEDEILEVIEREGFDVTLSGGDPVYQMPAIASLAKKIKEKGKTIWLYTGFTWEELCQDEDVMKNLMPYIDVVVDSPYIEQLRDTSLAFRGSSNQRILRVQDLL